MEDAIVYPLFQATLAQVLGVSIALLGCIGVLVGRKKEEWSMWRWGGILVPFLLAYGTFIAGLVVYQHSLGNSTPVGEITYMKVILLYLFADAILLPIAVGFSGGVKQSLFSPLFFAITAMAVVFVPQSAVSWLRLSPIFWITVVTLAGYLIVYWLSHCLPHLFTTAGGTPNLFYNMCECIVLAGSVALTVLMSCIVPGVQ